MTVATYEHVCVMRRRMGMTPTNNTILSLKTDPIIGNCTGHPTPDMWYPEFPTGRPNKISTKVVAMQIKVAKSFCDTCPSKQRCLEAGNEPNDLPFGIWGGKLAGERILDMGYIRSDFARQSDLGRALDFHMRIKPYIEE
jgi:hypothetical protein